MKLNSVQHEIEDAIQYGKEEIKTTNCLFANENFHLFDMV